MSSSVSLLATYTSWQTSTHYNEVARFSSIGPKGGDDDDSYSPQIIAFISYTFIYIINYKACSIQNKMFGCRWQTARRRCPLVNECHLISGFSFFLPLSHFTPTKSGIPWSYRVHIWCGKARMAGLQSGEGRMMIDSVVWAQHINRQTHRQPRRHSKCRANKCWHAANDVYWNKLIVPVDMVAGIPVIHILCCRHFWRHSSSQCHL